MVEDIVENVWFGQIVQFVVIVNEMFGDKVVISEVVIEFFFVNEVWNCDYCLVGEFFQFFVDVVKVGNVVFIEIEQFKFFEVFICCMVFQYFYLVFVECGLDCVFF